SHRKAGHCAHVPRDLVACEVLLAEVAKLLLSESLALAHDHAGAQLFSVPRVGNADALDVEHFRVPVQELLDFTRVDVLTAANDHVLHSSDDAAVALVVD